jgi:tetratricopeptide (TPR) repeat protein
MAKDAEIRDLQKAAQEFYESKKYGEALESYNKAVVLAQKWSPSDVPAILDQRVAVHVKLGNIDMARQDAMGMIRNNKADGRGYLRCGQLDRLGGDLAAALRWYEHGLKHVSSNDPLRSALNAQRNKTKGLLEQKLMASNARDPVSTLPAELIQHIATYLDYIELVKVLRVSKAWKETLSSLKPLTDSVDFSDGRCEITYKMMAAVLKRLGKNPKRLIMKNLAYSAEELLRTDLLRWQRYTQLEELTARQMIHGGTNIPYAKYNLKYLSLTMPEKGPEFGTISDILNECKALEVVCFTNVNRNHLPPPEGQGITVESARPNMRVFQLFCSNREGSPHRRLNVS